MGYLTTTTVSITGARGSYVLLGAGEGVSEDNCAKEDDIS